MKTVKDFFEPVTFGVEWETFLANEKLLPVRGGKVERFIDLIRERLPWSETGWDMIMATHEKILEFRTGIVSDLRELFDRFNSYYSTVRTIEQKEEAMFFPIGSTPHMGAAVGLHIHIGSVYSMKLAVELANGISRYTPVIAAIMANSPFWGNYRKPGEYKSYRVKNMCDFCSSPWPLMDKEFNFPTWGTDICPKVCVKPTIEVRVCDCPSFVEFLNEAVAFIVGFIISFGYENEPCPTREEYVQSIINRWWCSKKGLQAKIWWRGRKEQVTDVARKMLSRSKRSLKKAGFKVPEFTIIGMMLDKKLTQADMQIDLYDKGMEIQVKSAKEVPAHFVAADKVKPEKKEKKAEEPKTLKALQDKQKKEVTLD